MNWSEVINKVMRENRVSEYGLADLTGIRQPTIHDLRRRKTKNPQPNTIKRLEEGLGIKIDDTGEEITYEKIGMSPQVKKSKPKTLKKLQEVGVASDNFTEIGRGINQSNMDWADLINKVMREFRVSEYGLGDLTGIRQPTIHDIRRRRTKNPQPNTIKRLEDNLGIKIDDTGEEITYEKIVPMHPHVMEAKAIIRNESMDKGIKKSKIIKYQADKILELEEEIRKLKGGAK